MSSPKKFPSSVLDELNNNYYLQRENSDLMLPTAHLLLSIDPKESPLPCKRQTQNITTCELDNNITVHN